VKIKAVLKIIKKASEIVAEVAVNNPSDNLAFMIRLSITKGESGIEITPSYWEDNYFSLLPRESKIVIVRFTREGLDNKEPILKVVGWNIE
jgi:exo-1,4-beta-D-glucosaminidase